MKIQKKLVCVSLCMSGANLIFFLLFSQAAFAEIQITPGITMSETYYDEDRDPAAGGDSSDYITAVSPSISLAHLSEKTQLNLFYSPSFVWYDEQNQNDTVRHSASLDLAQQLSTNLNFHLSDAYTRTEEPIEVLETLDIIRPTRSVYQSNTGSAELQYRFGPENTFNLGYSNALLMNEDPTLDDGIIHRPYLGYTYWFNIKNGITMNYSYTKAEFSRDDGLAAADDYKGLSGGITYTHRFKPQTTGSIGYNYTIRYFDGVTEDYKIHDAFLGLTHSFSADLSLALQCGYFVQDRERSPSNFSGLNYSASLNKSFAQGSYYISGLGGWSESYLDTEHRGFTRFWSFQSGFDYQLAETVNSHAIASYRHDQDVSGQSWATVSGAAGITWSFYRYFSLSLDYSYISQDADVMTSDYNRNQIVLSLSASRLFML